MGYESRIYVMKRSEITFENRERPYILAEEIAMFDLRCLGYEHGNIVRDAFKTPIDFRFFENGDDTTTTDAYGDALKYCQIEELIAALSEYSEHEHYRRVPPLIACLSALIDDSDAWTDGELIAVHYGY
ncbi:MAG: hypothetical protein IKE23_12020 [Exiguobacterium sp.]|nr:hypothetical protein [Exiguobacterium sp.]